MYADGYQKRILLRYAVVLHGIFQEHLDGTWHDAARHELLRDIGIDLKSGGEADFQQVGIHSGECQFVAQVDELQHAVFQHVSVNAGQFVYESARVLVLVFADETVQDVQ